jgi:hypothetical protein
LPNNGFTQITVKKLKCFAKVEKNNAKNVKCAINVILKSLKNHPGRIKPIANNPCPGGKKQN